MTRALRRRRQIELDPEEVARRRAQREREEHEARERLELVARALRPLGDELPLERLMWDPARMPDCGMFGDQVAFVVRADDGAVVGVDLYVPPFTAERARVDAEGGLKLTAVPGSRRGLWPRPRGRAELAAASPDVLVAVEGPGTAATVLSLGFSRDLVPVRARASARATRSGSREPAGSRRSCSPTPTTSAAAALEHPSSRCARPGSARRRSTSRRTGSDGTDVADLARAHTDIDAARAWLLRELEPFTKGGDMSDDTQAVELEPDE